MADQPIDSLTPQEKYKNCRNILDVEDISGPLIGVLKIINNNVQKAKNADIYFIFRAMIDVINHRLSPHVDLNGETHLYEQEIPYEDIGKALYSGGDVSKRRQFLYSLYSRHSALAFFFNNQVRNNEISTPAVKILGQLKAIDFNFEDLFGEFLNTLEDHPLLPIYIKYLELNGYIRRNGNLIKNKPIFNNFPDYTTWIQKFTEDKDYISESLAIRTNDPES